MYNNLPELPYIETSFIPLCLGKQNRMIRSYYDIYYRELPIMDHGYQPLTEQQYVNILFNNMGFTRAPKASMWDPMSDGIEVCQKTEKLDLPFTRYPLSIDQKYDSLEKLLDCIKIWNKGTIEKGDILNQDQSFKLPGNEQLSYYQDKKFKLSRTWTLEKNVPFSTGNIWIRRLFNLNPYLDRKYFEYCIRKFRLYSQQIFVDDPCILFNIALVDTAIILAMIKKAEISSMRTVADKYYRGQVFYVSDYDHVCQFVIDLKENFKVLVDKFNNEGFEGFFDFNWNTLTPNIETKFELPYDDHGSFYPEKVKIPYTNPEGKMNLLEGNMSVVLESLDTYNKKLFVFNIPLDEDIIKYTNNRIDFESIPTNIPKMYKTQSGETIKNPTIDNIVRRSFCILRQLEEAEPSIYKELEEYKLIISKTFFYNELIFGLYSPFHNLFILCFDDMSFYMLDPESALQLFYERYGVKVQLEEDEINRFNLRNPAYVPYLGPSEITSINQS